MKVTTTVCDKCGDNLKPGMGGRELPDNMHLCASCYDQFLVWVGVHVQFPTLESGDLHPRWVKNTYTAVKNVTE